MQKFNNFNDFGSHVKTEKDKKLKEALIRLNQGVFVENLAHLNREQIEFIVPVDTKRHLNYIVENKQNILFKECILEKSVSWIQNLDTLVLIYTINIPETSEIIEIRPASSSINNNGVPVDVEFSIDDIFFEEAFLKKHKINDYTQEDYQLIELYNKFFDMNKPFTHNTKHALKQKSKIKVSKEFQYIISYELIARKQINAGISKQMMRITDTSNPSFSEKLRYLLETEYTMPMVEKKINELTDDDITVIQMGLI